MYVQITNVFIRLFSWRPLYIQCMYLFLLILYQRLYKALAEVVSGAGSRVYLFTLGLSVIDENCDSLPKAVCIYILSNFFCEFLMFFSLGG